MKKSIKLISLVITAIFAFSLLSGCGSSSSNNSDDNTASASAVETTKEASTAPQPGNPTLPLTKEPVTLKFFMPMTAESAKVLKSLNDIESYKELEKRTGVHIEWINPIIGNDAEQFNLLLASGDLPDLVCPTNAAANGAYPGGFDKAIADGVYLDIKDLVDKYAPNYKHYRDSDPQIKKETMTDKGNMPGFFQINTGEEAAKNVWGGFVVRQDWLDDLGLKTPVTYDDWYVMLKAFKEQKKAEAPMLLYKSGIPVGNDLISGHGVAAGFEQLLSPFYQVDGKVKYGPLEPGYKEYLTMMNKWYKEGLIDKDFYTRQNTFYAPDQNLIVTGKTGVFWASYNGLPVYKALSKDPKFKLAAIPAPVQKAGDKNHFNVLGGNSRTSNVVSITSACKNPEIAAKWCDYQYSPDGFVLVNYGIEGKTYTMVDGKPQYTEFVTKNPEGKTMNEVKWKWFHVNGATLADYGVEFRNLTEDKRTAALVWANSTDTSYYMPRTTTTEEEGTKMATAMADVGTYVQEMTLKFILGAEPLTNYDAFLKKIKDMNIEEVVEIQQSALERYLAR